MVLVICLREEMIWLRGWKSKELLRCVVKRVPIMKM